MPSINALKKSAEYGALTEQQQQFLVLYLENDRDASDAAAKSFNVSSRESAVAMGHKLLDNPRIQAAISFYEGDAYISNAEFYAQLKVVIEQDKSLPAKINALRLLSEIRGLAKGKKKSESDAQLLDTVLERIEEQDGQG